MTLLHEDMTHNASRLRTPTPEHLTEDLELVRQGILDERSLLSGYEWHNHPVEVTLKGADGKLKAIRRSHNLRTNIGGHDEAVNMSGTAVPVAQYVALSNISFVPSSTDTTLQGEISGSGASRTQATFAFVTDPSVTNPAQSSTAQGSYKLTANWTLSSNISGIQACAVFNALSGGDLWFESVFGSVNANAGDTLSLTYTINY